MKMVGGNKLLGGTKVIQTLIHNVYILLIILSLGTNAHIFLNHISPTQAHSLENHFLMRILI